MSFAYSRWGSFSRGGQASRHPIEDASATALLVVRGCRRTSQHRPRSRRRSCHGRSRRPAGHVVDDQQVDTLALQLRPPWASTSWSLRRSPPGLAGRRRSTTRRGCRESARGRSRDAVTLGELVLGRRLRRKSATAAAMTTTCAPAAAASMARSMSEADSTPPPSRARQARVGHERAR